MNKTYAFQNIITGLVTRLIRLTITELLERMNGRLMMNTGNFWNRAVFQEHATIFIDSHGQLELPWIKQKHVSERISALFRKALSLERVLFRISNEPEMQDIKLLFIS